MKVQMIEILEKIKTVSVAVYGDFCLDAYWIMDPSGSEVSVETGKRAEAVVQHYYSPGGAANVMANLAALQAQKLAAIGIIGEDLHGRELVAQLNVLGIDTSKLVLQKENFTPFQ